MKRLAVFFFLAALCFAKPNFSGQWKMDGSKTDFGPVPAPEKMIRTIQHEDPSINIKTEQAGPQGEIKTDVSYTTDGKEFNIKTQFGETKGTANWDGDTLVVKTKRQIQGMDIESTDRWTLGGDGKTMKISSNLKTPQGDFEITISFDKQ